MTTTTAFDKDALISLIGRLGNASAHAVVWGDMLWELTEGPDGSTIKKNIINEIAFHLRPLIEEIDEVFGSLENMKFPSAECVSRAE